MRPRRGTSIAAQMTAIAAEPGLSAAALYRLLAWSSPALPIGAFGYSHGLEAAAESGAVRDRPTLEAWLAAIVARGGGRLDADILCAAHRAATAGDGAALADANARGLAYRGSAELALESTGQGAAFLAICRAAWPDPLLEAWAAAGDAGKICHACAFGAAAGRAGVPLGDALLGYLAGLAANLVSAGLRLGLVGQSDGQRILAALEPVVAGATAAAMTRPTGAFGSAAFAVDLASMAHETQYTRLFRS
jgi:urease accessory protein